jgi:hypothetical protein
LHLGRTAPALALILACTAADAAPPPADLWEIGPIIRGRNYSVGMPEQPTPVKGGGWSFQFPYPTVDAGHVHYLTFPHGSLQGKTRIVMRYRIDAARGVRFVPREYPDQAATISLFFQRYRDSWTARGRYAEYRWYSPDAKMGPVAPGTHEIAIRLDDPEWIPVMGGTAAGKPAQFAAAIDNADRVGFVMGSKSTRGHGVFATGPAKFTLLDYRVE